MEETKATPQLDASRFKLAEHENINYVIDVEPGITRQHVLDPAFYAQFSSKLRPYDRIAVRCDDGSLYAELLVLNAERTWARVHVLSWHDLTTRDVSLSQAEAKEHVDATKIPTPAHRVEWKGPHHKWSVIRNTDDAYVHEGDAAREDADLWMREHERATV